MSAQYRHAKTFMTSWWISPVIIPITPAIYKHMISHDGEREGTISFPSKELEMFLIIIT